jgi:hypothetical protein
MGMALRYGAFTMWAILEQPKFVADRCEAILKDGLNNFSEAELRELKKSLDEVDDGADVSDLLVETVTNQMGKEEKMKFRDEIGGAFWASKNCWAVEHAFLNLHENEQVYEACSSFMQDHINFVASKVDEHGSMEKYIESLSTPENNASTP